MAAEAPDDGSVTMNKTNNGRIKELGRDRVQPVRAGGGSHSVVSVLRSAASALSENRGMREIHDPDALAENFPGSAKINQMGSGLFLARVGSIGFDSTAVHRSWIGQRMRLRVRAAADTLLIGYVAAASDVVVCEGLAWSHTELLAVGVDEVDICTFGLAGFVWLEFRGTALKRLGLQTSRLLEATPGAFHNLRRCAEGPGPFSSTALVDATSAALHFSQVVPRTRTTSERCRLVKRVEEFMSEHLDEPLSLNSICAEMRCRPRTLIYAFNATLGMGPIAYLKVQRLNRVKRMLQAPDFRRSRILDLAGDCGFWHLGHFGAAYKSMFGVTPSQTRSAANN